MVGLLQAMGVHAEPSLIHTLPSACGLNSLRDEVQTLPSGCAETLVGAYTSPFLGTLPGCWAHSPGWCLYSQFPLRWGADTPWSMRTVPVWVARWRGDWSCCCREVPQSAPEVLFLFGKILLLNTVAPSVQGRSCPLTQPTSPARPGTFRVRVAHGPSFNSPQPAPTVSVGLPLRPYSPACDFKQSGLSQYCLGFVWQGKEVLNQLSPRSPEAGPAGAGLGLQPPWSRGLPCDLNEIYIF